MGDRPIFVVGAQRSGTTLVRLLLDAHPRLSIGPETEFLKDVRFGAERMRGGGGTKRTDAYTVGVHEAERELAAAWARILSRHAKARGARRWGDKSPVHRYHGERIRRLFPGAQLVAVVRHPAAVALSRQKWGYEPDETIRDWGASVRWHRGDAERFGAADFHLLRYEDLLTDPEPALRRLVAFLGEPWDDAVLAQARQGGDEAAVTDGGTRTDEPIDPGRASAWTERADDGLLDQLDELVPDEMAQLGYRATLADPIGPLPVTPLSAPPTLPPTDVLTRVRRTVSQQGVAPVAGKALRELRRSGPAALVRRVRR